PQEQVGTYPLPESQCDRFLLSFGLGYPDHESEMDLLAHDGADGDLNALESVINRDDLLKIRTYVRDIHISPEVRSYLLNIIEETRHNNAIVIGASPRASLALQRACQAHAFVSNRDFVIPEDVQELVRPCLAHRILMRSGQDSKQCIHDIIDRVAVPR
ncbi:MAG: MoxR family ATPase, partial [Planctomycetes bacterium]|nr:MoxR family ATPase [Planctomycetota bacterium]